MSQYRVGLVCSDPRVLPELSNLLKEPWSTIVEEEGIYYWSSTRFDALATVLEVDAYATRLLRRLNGLVKLYFRDAGELVKAGRIKFIDNQSQEQTLLTLSTSAVATFIIHENEELKQKYSKRWTNIAEKILEENNNSLVDEALQYFSLQKNWTNLEKIFEIIAKDLGEKENNGTLPRGTFDKWTQGSAFGKQPPGRSFDFLQTAHSYHWSGLDARHSSVGSQKRTGVTPMSLQEGVEYIANLLVQWLETNP